MRVRRLVERVRERQAEGIVVLPVPVEDPNGSGTGGSPAFVPGEVYLEVRIRQMWLTNERELWSEYQPFTTVITEFLVEGKRVAIPCVLGAAELNRRLGGIAADDSVEFGNIRVAGPVPYEGDDLSMLVALFRVKTADWLAWSFSLLQDVASTVGFGGLARMTDLAATLVRNLEALDAKGAELRVGAYWSWGSPGGQAGDPVGQAELAPMHLVVMRRPRVGPMSGELDGLRVRDGRLHAMRDGVLVPYSEHDFIVISIEARRFRDDYRQLAFYGLWKQTKQHVIDGDIAAARRTWRQTCGAIYTDELTRPQQQALFTEYERQYADLIERFGSGGASSHRGELQSGRRDEDDDPETILRRAFGAG